MGRNQKDLAGGGCIEVMPTEQFGYDIVIGTNPLNGCETWCLFYEPQKIISA